MRILVVSEVFWPEDFLVNDLVREWAAMGHEVHVITQYPSYPASYVFEGYRNQGCQCEDWEGVKIHRFPFIEGYRDSKVRKILNYYSFVRGGKRVADSLKEEFDCVFVSQTGPLTVALPALHLKKKRGIPVNIWTFDIWPDVVWSYGIPKNRVTGFLLDKIIRKVYTGCDRIFISSKRFADTIGEYTDRECLYAPSWLKPVRAVESELRLSRDKFHFTFTGNVSRYQNLLNTVEGFHRAGLENAQLNIVGDGSFLEEVKKAAVRLGARGVVFHGRRPYDQMHDILMQSDVLVLPLMPQAGVEKTEPYKIQSYLEAGKPIMGVLNGAGREIIEENHLGLCADPADPGAIARVFKEMLPFSQERGAAVGESAKRLMGERFNKQITVKRITDNLIVK